MDHPKNHSSVGWLDFPGIYGWPSQNRGSLSPKWMVKIMENPMNKLMIWGYHYFWKHPYTLKVQRFLLFECIFFCKDYCFSKGL